VETRDGHSKTINNSMFYNPKKLEHRYEKRYEFWHGANNYLYLRGNYHIYDGFVLDAVLETKFIDVNNVAYDYDVTQEFTWDWRELVQIKKRQRVMTRI